MNKIIQLNKIILCRKKVEILDTICKQCYFLDKEDINNCKKPFDLINLLGPCAEYHGYEEWHYYNYNLILSKIKIL